MVLGLDRGGNGLLLGPLPNPQHLCSPDTLQWPWSGPAGKGEKKGLEWVA